MIEAIFAKSAVRRNNADFTDIKVGHCTAQPAVRKTVSDCQILPDCGVRQFVTEYRCSLAFCLAGGIVCITGTDVGIANKYIEEPRLLTTWSQRVCGSRGSGVLLTAKIFR